MKNRDNCYYVYEWIRLDTNQTFYVGKGKGNRAFVPKKNNSNFMRIFEKHDTAVCILEKNLLNSEAIMLEKEYIDDYVFNQGYGINIDGYRESDVGHLVNCTWGGEGAEGRKCKKETKKKIGEKNKGKSHPQTEETRRTISRKLKAYNRTDKHCENISKALKGRITNPEALEKMILWTKTAVRTETHKNNISLALKGKKKSLNHRKAISNTKKSKGDWKGDKNPKAEAIAIIFPNGDIKEFKTKSEAGEIIPRTIIRRCLNESKPYKVPRNYMKKYKHLEGIIVKLI